MALIDITVPLRPGAVPVYPGDTELAVETVWSQAAGDVNTVSKVVCTAHCGTHVDAPVHFLPDGGGIDSVPLARWSVARTSSTPPAPRVTSTRPRWTASRCRRAPSGSCCARPTAVCGIRPASRGTSSR